MVIPILQCDSTTVHTTHGKVRCVLEPGHADTEHRCAFKSWPESASHAATSVCGCATNTAGMHVKECPIWINVGPSLAERHYVRRDAVCQRNDITAQERGPAMTPTQELRAAAAKIRGRAEEATRGPWRVDHREYPEAIYGGSHQHSVVVAGSRWNGESNIFDNNGDAYHIALWHPGIALLVAALLESAASVAEEETWLGTRIDVVLAEELALARAINSTEVA